MRHVAWLPVIVLACAAGLVTACDPDCDPGPEPHCGGGLGRQEFGASNVCGDSYSCHMMWVPSGLAVGLGALDDGTYSLVGSADDEPFACSLEVVGLYVSADCPEGADGIGTEHREQPTLEILGAPCSVTLALSRGDTVLASGTLAPQWTWDEPNGDGCGWVASAHADLTDFDP